MHQGVEVIRKMPMIHLFSSKKAKTAFCEVILVALWWRKMEVEVE